MKREILFLTFAEIIEIHGYQIGHFGGSEGLRDIELLKSAIGMPSATFGGEYLHTTIAEMAAAYLYHLVENHPFVDGNKRVGAMAALIFLDLNGYDFDAPDAEFTDMVMKIASGKMLKAEITLFLRQHTHSRP
ncbi:MAG: type II toxin-antitoxin system death-on-curing family toxin [Victivallaceae bacterium]|nr:type II toxin-antitoxin system death-on-curing family toxin [Victivallaceae bacterium]